MPSFSIETLTQLSYLVAAALFILGLKRMSSPVTAVSGVRWAGLGMLLATLATLGASFRGVAAQPHPGDRRHRRRRHPRLGQRQARRHDRHAADDRALQRHGRRRGGGDCRGRAVPRRRDRTSCISRWPPSADSSARCPSAAASSPSRKLQGLITKSVRFGGQKIVNLLILLVTLVFGVMIVAGYDSGLPAVSLFFACALLLGIAMTLPIGGADMPVVISLYNALTGLAVGFEGFVLDNAAMIIAGTVVGAAGTLLTQLMAKAMNRSLGNVLFANFGETSAGGGTVAGTQKPIEASDAGVMMAYAQKIIVVPGLRPRGRTGAAQGVGARATAHRPRRAGTLRHSSRGRPHAGSHERAPRRGRRALRPDLRPRRDQCRVRDRRRGRS